MRDTAFLLAVTPPRTSPVTLAGQAQMLAGLAHARRAARRGVAVEIVGEGGHVRFLARPANASARLALEGALAGYYPQGSVVPLPATAGDPACVRPGEAAVAAELRLRQRPELPLKIADRPTTSTAVEDPSAGLQRAIGALRRLDSGTRGVCQLILWPGPHRWGAHIARERDRAIARERALGAAREEDVPVVVGPLAALGALGALGGVAAYHAYTLYGLAGLIPFGEAAGGGLVGLLALWRLAGQRRVPSSALLARKAASPAFTARLRLLVAGGDREACARGLDTLIAAYGAFAEETGNTFVARRCVADRVMAVTMDGGPRLWPRPWPILSADEVAALWHLPADAVDVPGLARSGPRALLPSSEAFASGVPIGVATVGTHTETVHLPAAIHRGNTVVLGATGTGKSTFAQHLVRDALDRDDVQIVVIDPDADLVYDIVGWLPDAQKLRAVVVDVGHPTLVPGINLLDAHTGRDDDQVVGAIVEAWRRYYDAWGERLEDLLRNALRTLLLVNHTRRPEDQLTLFDVKPLLQDGHFRAELIRQADDIRVARYWHKDYLEMPRSERLNATKPVLTRVGKLADNQYSLALLSQPASTIDLRALFTSGAPLFFNSAAEVITDEAAALLDATLINVLHSLVCARPEGDKAARQVLIIIDEFQHAPALYDKYLPRIRKHRGSYVCIAQGIGQVDALQEGLHQTVFNNAATHVFFRTRDYHDADYLAHVLDGETLSYRDLQLLGLRQCYVATTDGERPLDPVLVTLPPPPPTSPAAARLIAAACARRYGQPRDAVVAAYKKWLAELYHADRMATQAQAPATQSTASSADGTDRDGGEGGHRNDHPPSSMPPGSQPACGVPVQRAGPGSPQPKRSSRRHKGPRLVPVGPAQLRLPVGSDAPAPSRPATDLLETEPTDTIETEPTDTEVSHA